MDSEETLRATLKQYELEKVQITQLVLDAKDLAVKAQLEAILSELCDAIKHTCDSIMGLKKVQLLENLAKGKYNASPALAEAGQSQSSGASTMFPVGSKCQLVWNSEGGAGEWLDAEVFKHLGAGDDAVGRNVCTKGNSGQEERVVVTLTTPTFIYMKSCRFLSQGTCRYGASCRFSHGFTVPISRLRPFVKAERQFQKDDACLAKYHEDGLWYPAIIVEAGDEGFFTVSFDGFEGEEAVGCDDVVPLPPVCQHSTGPSVENSEKRSDFRQEQLWKSGSGLVRTLSDEAKHSIGGWEAHTKGFGSRMLEKMGFKRGTGLGKHGQGVLVPVGFNKVLPPGISLDFVSKSVPRQKMQLRPVAQKQTVAKKTTAFSLIDGLGGRAEETQNKADYILPSAPKNGKTLKKKVSSANKRTNLRIVNDQIAECNRAVRELQAQVNRNPTNEQFKNKLQLASNSLNSLKRSAVIMKSALKATNKPFKF